MQNKIFNLFHIQQLTPGFLVLLPVQNGNRTLFLGLPTQRDEILFVQRSFQGPYLTLNLIKFCWKTAEISGFAVVSHDRVKPLLFGA